MESLSLTRNPTTSSPKSSGKRTSSPGARTPQAKRPKMDLRQVHSNRDKKRRRKKKKQPMTRDSSGLAQNECSSSLAPDPPLPSASSSTESCQRFLSPQSDFLPGRPLTPAPCVNSKPVGVSSSINNGNRSPGSLAPLGQERVVPTLHDENKSFRDHKALLTSLLSSLVCQICLDLLHKPFALSPCGHVSCYSCLVNWFTIDQRPGEPEVGHVFREKTCPQCRAVVRERPIEAWNVKDMVATLVKSRLVRDFLPSVEVNSKEATPRESASSAATFRDPWASIFPPRPGLPLLEGSPSVLGMFDAEDQVYRCLDCMHEIWGGSCSRCGRHYDAHNVDASDDEASAEELHGMWSILPVMEHIMGRPRGVSVNGSEDGSYEASFIDDGEGEDSEGDINEAVEISTDGNNSVIEVTAVTTRQGREGAGESCDEDEDDHEKVIDASDTDESRSVQRRPAIRSRPQVLSDRGGINSDGDDGDVYSVNSDEEDDGSLARPPMRLFGRVHSRRSFISEDENGDSQFSGSGDSDSDDVGSDDGDTFGVQWSGGGFGGFTADEEDDEEL
ncbi:hypothetical protein BJV78DRAFT_1224982 [Lactifluus subvellereus]|nr:hypothetical protein BJV78DRAFT_1224982 [Lactifluus subvellereus]